MPQLVHTIIPIRHDPTGGSRNRCIGWHDQPLEYLTAGEAAATNDTIYPTLPLTGSATRYMTPTYFAGANSTCQHRIHRGNTTHGPVPSWRGRKRGGWSGVMVLVANRGRPALGWSGCTPSFKGMQWYRRQETALARLGRTADRWLVLEVDVSSGIDLVQTTYPNGPSAHIHLGHHAGFGDLYFSACTVVQAPETLDKAFDYIEAHEHSWPWSTT